MERDVTKKEDCVFFCDMMKNKCKGYSVEAKGTKFSCKAWFVPVKGNAGTGTCLVKNIPNPDAPEYKQFVIPSQNEGGKNPIVKYVKYKF